MSFEKAKEETRPTAGNSFAKSKEEPSSDAETRLDQPKNKKELVDSVGYNLDQIRNFFSTLGRSSESVESLI